MKKIIVILIIMLPILSMAQNKAHIQFENINHDYGEIAVRANGDHGFVFTNTGSAPLVINEVVTSCGCTAVAWPKKPLPVGSSDSIVIKYDTRRAGVFNKSVIVKTNADNPNITLSIKGNVVRKARGKK